MKEGLAADELLTLLKSVDRKLYEALMNCDDYQSLREAVRQIYYDTIPELEKELL